MTITEQKQAAYDYLISLGLLPADYLQQRDRDFDTGDIFGFGVPAEPQDAARALEGLSSRASALIDDHTWTLKHPADSKEVGFLEETNAMLMVLRIPSQLGWQVPDSYKGTFATLLGAVWHQKKNSWLGRRIKRRERMKELKEVTPTHISAYILNAPLDDFSKRKKSKNKIEKEHFSYATELDQWLTNKVAWRIEKENREPSLDEPLSGSDPDSNETTFSEMVRDVYADDATVRDLDRKILFDKLVRTLPEAIKAATIKFLRGEKLTPTEQRAKDRGVEKMAEFCKKHGIESPN